MDMFDWLITGTAALSLSFWAYTSIFYEKLKQGIAFEGTEYLQRYTQGFLIFSMLNWAVSSIALCVAFGWKIGSISSLVLFLGGLSIIAGITTNQIYRLIGLKADISMMFLCILVWIQIIFLILQIFI